MAQSMPGPLLRLWMAFERIEPAGDDRTELAVARLSSLVYNRTRAKSERPKGPREFMFQAEEVTPEAVPQQRDPGSMWRALKGRFLASAGVKPESVSDDG